MDFLLGGFREEEKTEKVWSFAKPGVGGGVSRRVVKSQTSILGSKKGKIWL